MSDLKSVLLTPLIVGRLSERINTNDGFVITGHFQISSRISKEKYYDNSRYKRNTERISLFFKT
jgi:hypothetical protein